MAKSNGRRVILFPLPLQGCINPMLQLAKILHSRGFSITVIHTRFRAPKASSHPLFTFLQIPDGLSETEKGTRDVTLLLTLLNRSCESAFRDCLTQLLRSADSETEEGNERISCLIDDSGWIFTQPLAQSLNLPRLALNTYKVSFFRDHFVIPRLRRETYLPLQDSEQDDPVEEFPPIRKKDLLRILKDETEVLDAYSKKILETTKASSGLIFVSSCEELDQDSLSQARQDFHQVPIFAIGPSHSYFPGSSSSLFTPDKTCIPWLDKQEDRSVVYVSFGSSVTIRETELMEIAWGLRNSDQPFLWVVRVGSVSGAKWIESIPEEFMERLSEKGKIVKWAPQEEVLKHRAVGGFLTHNGWNSTVESISEGVPMICLPFFWDQMLNARFVSEIWMVGLHLENRIEIDEIERAIRRLMLETEGEAIRERMELLKEKVGRSVKQNGSAYRSLEDLVNHISSF